MGVSPKVRQRRKARNCARLIVCRECAYYTARTAASAHYARTAATAAAAAARTHAHERTLSELKVMRHTEEEGENTHETELHWMFWATSVQFASAICATAQNG